MNRLMDIRHIPRILRRAFASFSEDDVMSRSAALSFYTLLSFAPLMVLGVWLTSTLGHGTQKIMLGQIATIAGDDARKAAQVVIDSANKRPSYSTRRARGFRGIRVMQWPPHRRWPWIVLAVIVVVAVGARLALAGWVTDYLNGKLDRMGDYHGSIESVDLHLWRGAYSINGLRIAKRTAKVPVPLLAVPRTDLSVSWRALLDGGVVASVDFQRPEINFVDSDNEAKQSGAGVDWRERLEGLMPIRVDEVRVQDGTVRFRNFTSQPKVDLKTTQVQARVLNLTNVRDSEDARAAELELSAHMLGQAPLESGAKFDPFTPFEDFHFRLKLNKVELRRLNEFLQAYAKLDVESGEGDFIMELEARDKQLNGYAKPLFYNVQIFSVEQDIGNQGDNPLRALWEAVAGGIENLFKNQPKNQFATRVEIRGSVGNADTSAWQAIVAVVRNAFVEAFRPQFEDLPAREPAKDDASKTQSD